MKKTDLLANEYGYFYTTYLNVLDDGDELLDSLWNGKKWFTEFVEQLSDEKLNHRYAKDKWTVAEVLLHIIDTERIFQYRAFRFSRNDMTPLPGFEQDGYILESDSSKRSKKSILEEFLVVRQATIELFNHLDEDKLRRVGTASDMPWSVAALGFVISGHQKHHAIILKERYFLD